MRLIYILLLFLSFSVQAQEAWTQLNDFPFEADARESFIYNNEAYVVISDQIYKYDESGDSWSFLLM